MNEREIEFLSHNHSAIIITVRKDGSPHVARVNCALIDGKMCSSGTQTRVRTRHLRSNPKAALCVLKEDNHALWLGVEGRVKIHELPDAFDRLLALRRLTGREPDDIEAFRQTMIREQRLIFELTPERTYGRFED
jgi:PPOX class probable F420-dependent enzyme